MGWLIYQTWLLLLIAFLLGCMTAWLAAALFVPDSPDPSLTLSPSPLSPSATAPSDALPSPPPPQADAPATSEPTTSPPPRVDASAASEGEANR